MKNIIWRITLELWCYVQGSGRVTRSLVSGVSGCNFFKLGNMDFWQFLDNSYIEKIHMCTLKRLYIKIEKKRYAEYRKKLKIYVKYILVVVWYFKVLGNDLAVASYFAVLLMWLDNFPSQSWVNAYQLLKTPFLVEDKNKATIMGYISSVDNDFLFYTTAIVVLAT